MISAVKAERGGDSLAARLQGPEMHENNSSTTLDVSFMHIDTKKTTWFVRFRWLMRTATVPIPLDSITTDAFFIC